MSISSSDKTYWINELSKAIDAKVMSILRKNGQLDLLITTRAEITKKLQDELGVTELLNQAKVWDKKAADLEEKKKTANTESSKLKEQARTILYGHYVKDPNETVNSWSRPSVEDMTHQLVEGQFLDELETKNSEVATLLGSKKKLERVIMQETSSKQMQEFLKSFCEKLGLNLYNDSLL
jgi:hypothetical protein